MAGSENSPRPATRLFGKYPAVALPQSFRRWKAAYGISRQLDDQTCPPGSVLNCRSASRHRGPLMAGSVSSLCGEADMWPDRWVLGLRACGPAASSLSKLSTERHALCGRARKSPGRLVCQCDERRRAIDTVAAKPRSINAHDCGSGTEDAMFVNRPDEDEVVVPVGPW